MKLFAGTLVMILLLAGCLSSSNQGRPRVEPVSFSFTNMPVSIVVEEYARLRRTEGVVLAVSSNVTQCPGGITFTFAGTPAAARKAVEEVLLEQAGVVVSELCGHCVSVTHNDALDPSWRAADPELRRRVIPLPKPDRNTPEPK
jgi:hypothetical protein